nr:immunoglobulin-like domain-containing protein [Pseudomonas monteilii]
MTLSNNAQVTIKAGDTSAPYEHAAQGDDVYNDAGQISVGIKSAVDVDGRTSRTWSWAALRKWMSPTPPTKSWPS